MKTLRGPQPQAMDALPLLTLLQTHALLICGASLEKITYHPNLCASPDLRDINLICRNQSLGSGPHRADPYTQLGDEGVWRPRISLNTLPEANLM